MLSISPKKYQEMKEKYTYTYLLDRCIDFGEEILHLRNLRDLDKECIQALLGITEVDTSLGPYEKSLVDQTLNQ